MDHSPLGDIADDQIVSFADAAIIQLVSGDPRSRHAVVAPLHEAVVTISADEIAATHEDFEWAWPIADLQDAVHAVQDNWTVLVLPGIDDFGVQVADRDVAEFRRIVERRLGHLDRIDLDAPFGEYVSAGPDPWDSNGDRVEGAGSADDDDTTRESDAGGVPEVEGPELFDQHDDAVTSEIPTVARDGNSAVSGLEAQVDSIWSEPSPSRALRPPDIATLAVPVAVSATEPPESAAADDPGPLGLAGLDARSVSAWFGSHLVLDRVSLEMPAGQVTALIGPSGCGKSTFLRILNRMHEMIPAAKMAGEVILDGEDVYDPSRKLTAARREIGMVFQKPNPFPAMSIYDNTIASFRLTGRRATQSEKDDVVESCLMKAGLWNEVKDRLRQPGGGLSGGQQQRLCIARALAIRPRVLLMDEPCSALDPTSTRRIEETIVDLVNEVTIVIVTHNMQQAFRVSDRCAFFLAEQGSPGYIVEHGATSVMFGEPQDPRTNDYVNGRFG